MELPKKPRSFKKGRDDRVGLTALGADPEKARQDQLDLLHQVTNAKDVEGYRYLRNLDLKVGSSGFATWYMISSSFPLIAAAIGPLANMCAIAALAEPWLYYPSHSYPKDNGGTKYDTIKDKPWITALNAVSLLMGVLSNLSLLMNFAGRINYTFSQVFSIGGFFFAGVILMALTMICKYVLLTDELGLTSSFWHAVLTAACYFASSLLLFINEVGHLKGYYGATFNLSKAQRSLMLQNISLVVWIASGAGLFQYLMDLSYPDALYLCQVSLLTIGLGDLHPLRVVSRALMIPFALIGTLMLGLIIASIRSMILTSSSETLTWNHAERNRKREIKNLNNNSTSYNERDGFDKMREFHSKAETYRTWLHLFFAGVFFAAFLTLGALCFYLVEEDWTYFDGIYFCCLCLLTIGYGDPAPNSTVGRSFFIVWSMAAVPMMTILISSMGDTIILKAMEMSDRLGDWALEFHGFRLPSVSTRSRENLNESTTAASVAEDDGPDSPPGFHHRALSLFRSTRKNTNNTNNNKDDNNKKRESSSSDSVYEKAPEPVDNFPSGDYLQDLSNTIVELTLALQRTFNREVNDPHYKYSFDEWKRMLKLCSRLIYLRNPEAFKNKKMSPDERADRVMQGDSEGDSEIEEEICSITSILQNDQDEQAKETLEKAGLPTSGNSKNRGNSVGEIINASRNHSKQSGDGSGSEAKPSTANEPEIKFQEPKKPSESNGLPPADEVEQEVHDQVERHVSEIMPHYWLSDLSPLRFPVREVRIFNKKYLNTLEAVSLLMKKALDEAEGG
ncbi:Outward-rectifier potassium channel TOK1 [Yarrowia sp. E02]|nr:Outward-rectifier potassium channel TOK1 [Yarrowia sp. E02]